MTYNEKRESDKRIAKFRSAYGQSRAYRNTDLAGKYRKKLMQAKAELTDLDHARLFGA